MVFKWTEKSNNAFNLLKSDLVKIPRLQYPNPNKAFKLFTNVSKHSYSGILHQEEVPKEVNEVPNPVPIAYFSGSFSKTQQPWNSTQKECYTVYRSIQKFSFYLTGTKCTRYCGHKALAHFSLLVCPVQYSTTGHWSYSSLTSNLSTSQARRMWWLMQYPGSETWAYT